MKFFIKAVLAAIVSFVLSIILIYLLLVYVFPYMDYRSKQEDTKYENKLNEQKP